MIDHQSMKGGVVVSNKGTTAMRRIGTRGITEQRKIALAEQKELVRREKLAKSAQAGDISIIQVAKNTIVLGLSGRATNLIQQGIPYRINTTGGKDGLQFEFVGQKYMNQYLKQYHPGIIVKQPETEAKDEKVAEVIESPNKEAKDGNAADSVV